MLLHIDEIIHSLPQAVQGLFAHENAEIVDRGFAQLQPLPKSTPPKISVEKSLDPIAQRSAQNIGLFLKDYLHQLPEYQATGGEGKKLLAHWKKLLLESPVRTAEGIKTNFHQDLSRNFWQDLVSGKEPHHISKEEFHAMWDDWMRASGAKDINPERLGKMDARQWQDFVVRTRLHAESTRRYRKDTGVNLGF